MPATGEYLENPDFRYNHDPDFRPYMYEFLLPENVTPKGAVILCAGGDHGDCVIHEAYQSCLDFNKLGYQSFMLFKQDKHDALHRTGMRRGRGKADPHDPKGRIKIPHQRKSGGLLPDFPTAA
mgnify:CR=1 FL=1